VHCETLLLRAAATWAPGDAEFVPLTTWAATHDPDGPVHAACCAALCLHLQAAQRSGALAALAAHGHCTPAVVAGMYLCLDRMLQVRSDRLSRDSAPASCAAVVVHTASVQQLLLLPDAAASGAADICTNGHRALGFIRADGSARVAALDKLLCHTLQQLWPLRGPVLPPLRCLGVFIIKDRSHAVLRQSHRTLVHCMLSRSLRLKALIPQQSCLLLRMLRRLPWRVASLPMPLATTCCQRWAQCTCSHSVARLSHGRTGTARPSQRWLLPRRWPRHFTVCYSSDAVVLMKITVGLLRHALAATRKGIRLPL
jgi:hypothetical protein